MKITSVDKNSFTGIPFSQIRIKGNTSDYKLYNINRTDFGFLKSMYDAVDLKKLMPGLTKRDYTIWDELLKSAIDSGKSSGKRVFLETCDNVPCGILNYSEIGNLLHLNYVVTYPTTPGKRVPCAGQILFNELLKRFIYGSTQKIEMQALRESPFSPISMYMKLGFKSTGGDNYSESMRINKERAMAALEKQREFITTNPIKLPANEDLSQTLNINYG